MIVPPQITAEVLTGIAQDLGVVGNEDGLMVLIEQFSERQGPRLKLRQAHGSDTMK